MPWFHEVLTSISRLRSRPRIGIRVLAAALSAVLVFGSVAPGMALAGEVDSEQEGTAPPGALPGLEEPELEPGGEETPLEELPGVVGAGEEAEEGPALETEPAQESQPQPPPEEATVQAPPPVSEEPTSAPAQGPEYETAAEPPPSAPVENQALAAPAGNAPTQSAQSSPKAAQPPAGAPAPASQPEEAPPPEVPQPPPAVPAQQGNSAPGSLAGHRVHVVRAGECLWSIAEALLPAGAGTAEIAAEVQRLWRLNASRIGTGNPSLVYAGTELALH
jgi:hypothetical protein